MNLDGKAWHVRWYRFVQRKLFDKLRDDKTMYATNLCHFMRVTCLWGPLFFGVMLGGGALLVLFFVVMGLIVLPILQFGLAGAAFMWLVIGGTGYSLYKGLPRFIDWVHTPLTEGSITHCFVEHARAVKGRFCPMIEIK